MCTTYCIYISGPSQIKVLKEDKSKLEGKVSSLSSELQSRTNEMNREIRRKERTEREVKQLRGELEERAQEIEALEAEAATVNATVARMEAALGEQRELSAGLQHQLEAMSSKGSWIFIWKSFCFASFSMSQQSFVLA